MLNNTRLEKNEHEVLSSDEINFGVDYTSFPNAMRIMAEKKLSFLTSTETVRLWELFIRTVNVVFKHRYPH